MDSLIEAIVGIFSFLFELLYSLFNLFGFRITALIISFVGVYAHDFQLSWIFGYIALAIILYSPLIYQRMIKK